MKLLPMKPQPPVTRRESMSATFGFKKGSGPSCAKHPPGRPGKRGLTAL